MRFVELDKLIEQRAGMRWRKSLPLHGEEFFRRLERDALTDLINAHQSMILGGGGGLVTGAGTYALLLRHTTTVGSRRRRTTAGPAFMRQGDRRPCELPQAREAAAPARRPPRTLYSRASITIDTSTCRFSKLSIAPNAP
jgi:shikimate kinase